MSDSVSKVTALAGTCARQLPASGTLDDAPAALRRDLDALTAAIAVGERFAFDLAGRPDAIAAIRQALPLVEADLLDAVLEDVACELAAKQEAMYQLALAAARTKPAG